jgi:hypothetical protein
VTAPSTRDALAKAIRRDFHDRECVYLDYDGPCVCDERADALLASGAVVDAATLADDEALVERVARWLYIANESETGALTWEELKSHGVTAMVEHYLSIARLLPKVYAAALSERGGDRG